MGSFYLTGKNGERHPLAESTLIGRSDECEIKLVDGHPSRRHARITIDADGVQIEDLDSANGTFVNGERVQGSRRVAPGDSVRFDATELIEASRFFFRCGDQRDQVAVE